MVFSKPRNWTWICYIQFITWIWRIMGGGIQIFQVFLNACLSATRWSHEAHSSFRNKLLLKTSSVNYLHGVPKGFVLCKVAYIFKVLCLTDLFMNLESFANIFLHFVLFVKNILVIWEMQYEIVSYVDDIAQQGIIYASGRIEWKMCLPCTTQSTICVSMCRKGRIFLVLDCFALP